MLTPFQSCLCEVHRAVRRLLQRFPWRCAAEKSNWVGWGSKPTTEFAPFSELQPLAQSQCPHEFCVDQGGKHAFRLSYVAAYWQYVVTGVFLISALGVQALRGYFTR
jgi:hypothetical protein